MNIKEIKEMVNLMNENNLTELEVEKEGMRIRLKKGPSGDISMEGLRNNVGLPPRSAEQPSTYPNPALPIKETSAQNAAPAKTAEIKSPMVGTFYRAPSPESPRLQRSIRK